MDPIILSQSGLYLFYGTLFLWAMSEIIGGKIIPHIRRRGAVVKKRNYGSNIVIGISWIAIILLSLWMTHASLLPLPGWSFYTGILLIFAGIGIRQWAIYVLGRYFSPVIGTQRNQKVVDTGPYRLVRHPSYTGLFIIAIGLGLATQSMAVLVLIIAVFAAAFSYRIAVEEQMLLSQLGRGYALYMKRTKRLVPFVV